MFSKRVPSEDPEHPLRTLFGERNTAGRALIDLTSSNPTLAGFRYPHGELGSVLSSAMARAYLPHPLGLPRARETLSLDWFARGREVDPEDIVLTASTSEAYGLLFKLLCDPGDQVLVPQPSYPLFEVLTRLEGVEAVGYRLEYDGAWHVDLDSARAATTSKARALILVSPNNPTGSYSKRSELEALRELGLPLICDEVFWPYALSSDPARVDSALAEDGPPLFVLDGLSKRCGLPQLKLGWITLGGALPARSEARSRLEVINDSYLSASTPVQDALGELLPLGAGIRQQIEQRCAQNHASLERAFAGSAVSVLTLEGGWSACLRLPALLSDDEWALALYREAQVLVQPGWFYDFARGSYLVVSLLTEPEPFALGLANLRHLVESRV